MLFWRIESGKIERIEQSTCSTDLPREDVFGEIMNNFTKDYPPEQVSDGSINKYCNEYMVLTKKDINISYHKRILRLYYSSLTTMR